MSGLAVQVENLTKSYGTVKAVAGISFEVRAGEIFGMLGPNGAGKSTTLSVLQGLRRADGGGVKVLGLDVRSHAVQIKQRIGVQLQRTSLLPNLTALAQVELLARLYGRAISRREAMKLLERVSLDEKAGALPGKLSGGQQQRLCRAGRLEISLGVIALLMKVLDRLDQWGNTLYRLDPDRLERELPLRAQLLRRILVFVALGCGLYLILGAAGIVRSFVFPFDAFELLAAVMVCVWLSHRGKISSATTLLLAISSHPASFLTAQYGLDSPAAALLLLTILFCGLFGGYLLKTWVVVCCLLLAYIAPVGCGRTSCDGRQAGRQ